MTDDRLRFQTRAVKAFECNSEDLEAMTATLGKLSEPQKVRFSERFQSAASLYIMDREGKRTPTPSAQRDQMNRIARAAEKLLVEIYVPDGSEKRRRAVALHGDKSDLPSGVGIPLLEGLAREIDIGGWADPATGLDGSIDAKLGRLITGVRLLRSAAARAAELQEDRTGSKAPYRGDDALGSLVHNLLAIYRSDAERSLTYTYDPYNETYQGAVLKFLRACLKALSDRAPELDEVTDGALARRVQDWRKSNDSGMGA